ncbi:Putative MhmaT1 transposase, partial [Caligus rogercresseyi]
MNMLGVSRTFTWRTKKVFKETGKIIRRPEQEMKRSLRTPRLTKAVAGKILCNPARSMNKMAQEYYISTKSIRR